MLERQKGSVRLNWRKYPDKQIYAYEMNPSTKRLLEEVTSDNLVKNIEIRGKYEYSDLRDLGVKLGIH